MAPSDVANGPLFSFGVVADIQYADKEIGCETANLSVLNVILGLMLLY